MSFETLVNRKEVLQKIADEFGVSYKSNSKSETIIAALEEDGVTWEDAAKFVPEVQEADVVIQEVKAVETAKKKEEEPKMLLRMMRENASYEIRGYRFTKSHPYGIVAESDGSWIVDNVPGFRTATPSEAQEFYS